MGAKGKLSVTIDTDILEAFEKVSKSFQVGKSRLAQEALELWLKMRTEELMAEGYMEMAREDKELAEIAFEAQREILQ